MDTSPIRVLIVDDSEPWRRYFSTTLRNEQELQVIGEVSDGLEAVQQAQELQPDLILLDIGLGAFLIPETSVCGVFRSNHATPETKAVPDAQRRHLV